MIVLLLGTNPYPFPRLLSAVDAWARATGERVIAQTGHTPSAGCAIECHPFVDHAQIMAWLGSADVVISQGGFGSIGDALRAGKPVIAAARRPELGESQDQQTEVVQALAAEGLVLALNDGDDLGKLIEQARLIKAKTRSESRIPAMVAEKIENVLGRA